MRSLQREPGLLLALLAAVALVVLFVVVPQVVVILVPGIDGYVSFLAGGTCRHLTGATLDVNGASNIR